MPYILLTNGQEKDAKRKEIQERTIKDVLKIWHSGQRTAIIVRPTGFGKTYTAANLMNMEDADGNKLFKRVLFCYPLNIIGNSLIEDINKINIENAKTNRSLIDTSSVICTTYQNLIRKNKDNKLDEYFGETFDLILFDEFHCAAAEKTSQVCKQLLDIQPDSTKVIGMTATYDRADNRDAGFLVFDDINLVFQYTYTDAVRDGLMPQLSYYDKRYYKSLDANGNENLGLKHELLKTNGKAGKLKELTIGYGLDEKIHNYGNILRQAVVETNGTEALNKPQRWIVFYPTKEKQEANEEELIQSFRTAFPDKKVLKPLVINEDKGENLDKLDQQYEDGKPVKNYWLEPRKNEVRIISCIRQLNMGYHTGNLDGAIFTARTNSKTVYQQQIGRTLNTFRETQPIIIDLAGNLDNIIEKYNDTFDVNIYKNENKSGTDVDFKTDLTDLDLIDSSCFVVHTDEDTSTDEITTQFMTEKYSKAAQTVISMLFMRGQGEDLNSMGPGESLDGLTGQGENLNSTGQREDLNSLNVSDSLNGLTGQDKSTDSLNSSDSPEGLTGQGESTDSLEGLTGQDKTKDVALNNLSVSNNAQNVSLKGLSVPSNIQNSLEQSTGQGQQNEEQTNKSEEQTNKNKEQTNNLFPSPTPINTLLTRKILHDYMFERKLNTARLHAQAIRILQNTDKAGFITINKAEISLTDMNYCRYSNKQIIVRVRQEHIDKLDELFKGL